MKRALVLFLIALLLFGLFACDSNEKKSEDTLCSVEFRTGLLPYTAAAPDPVTVKKGENLSEPTLPVTPTAGYLLIWTKDESARTPYDFSLPVTESFTLYAVEIPRTYTVTYLVEHGTPSASNPRSFTKETSTISLAKAVMDFGYRFLCWSSFDDPNSVVTEIAKGTEEDLVLRAVCEPVSYSVHYADPGDENPNPSSYLFGTELVLSPPTRAGYKFLYYSIASDPENTKAEKLTAQFVLAHKEAIFNGNNSNGTTIFLRANWEEENA